MNEQKKKRKASSGLGNGVAMNENRKMLSKHTAKKDWQKKYSRAGGKI